MNNDPAALSAVMFGNLRPCENGDGDYGHFEMCSDDAERTKRAAARPSPGCISFMWPPRKDGARVRESSHKPRDGVCVVRSAQLVREPSVHPDRARGYPGGTGEPA